MSEEWGEWQMHDGKGCPCRGAMVESEERCGLKAVHIAGGINPGAAWSHWDWASCFSRSRQIIRYRIRKPRALLNLIERAKELDDAPEGPVRVKPRVNA